MVSMWLSIISVPALANAPAVPADCTTLEVDKQLACETANEILAVRARLVDLGDCTAHEDEARTTCASTKETLEARLAELQPPPPPGKGGKAKRSDTNRLELDVTDE